MSGKVCRIKIEDILNYYENPRHAVAVNEKDTLKKLFAAVGNQYMLNLAEDIQEHGTLGNQQIAVVYSEDQKKYVVYEGNRRVAALKLLHNPDYFDFLDSPTRARAKSIASKGAQIKDLACYVTNEEDAFFIMERTHSGEDKGRGVKSWTAREKEAFKVRRNKSKNLSYLIDIYIKKHFNGFDITTVLPFTTIQRIFNNREVRKVIGTDVYDESTFTHERMQLILDASLWIRAEADATGVSVTRLFNKAREIEDKLLPWLATHTAQANTQELSGDNNAASHLTHQRDADSAQASADSGQAYIALFSETGDAEEIHTGRSNDRDISSNSLGGGGSRNLPYFFQGIIFSNLDPNDPDTHGVSAVCKELKGFSDKRLVSSYPIAAAFLIRSIIEHSIKYYSKKHTIQAQGKLIWEDIKDISKLSKIIEKYNRNLPNYIPDASIRQYFTSLFANYETNVDPLNWVVHRPSEFQLDAATLIDLPKKGLLTVINYLLS